MGGGIEPERLHPLAFFLRGWNPSGPYPFGLDDSFDGIGWVGQPHAKAGTPYSHLSHTGWFDVWDQQVNELSIGELGTLALCAVELGVPCILACGEAAFTREAEALTPGIVTAAVKEGTLPDGLDHLSMEEYRTAKLGARHCSPVMARERIRTAARKAAQKRRRSPRGFAFPSLNPPYRLEIFLRARQGHPPTTLRYTHPSSLVALFNLRYAHATPQEEADPLLKNRDRGRSTPESAEGAV